jgi:membrane-associated phospholipid phosphatase
VPHPIELSKLGSRWAFSAAAVLVGFVGLAVVAHRAQHGTALDHSVLGWMIDHRRDWLTTVAIIITNAGSPVAVGLLAALVAALLWWHRRSPTSAVVVVATLAVATGLSTVTKVVVGAERPPSGVQLLSEVDPSFPSGHVTGTLALVGIVAFVVGRGRRLVVRVALASTVLVATAAVALTRLYLGVHWLTDIGGGLLLGGAAVLAGSACSEFGEGAESPVPRVTRVA